MRSLVGVLFSFGNIKDAVNRTIKTILPGSKKVKAYLARKTLVNSKSANAYIEELLKEYASRSVR